MKNYISILYYNHNNQFDKIAVGLLFFNNEKQIIKIKKDKLDFVKRLNKIGYNLFESTIYSFESYYNDIKINYDIVERQSRYNNGMFQLTKPSFISLELNDENFNRYFEKFI